MKQRLFGDDVPNGLIKGCVMSGCWSLCIGAGTSIPVFPSWKELVTSIIKEISPDAKQGTIAEILLSFDLDALIQAACNIKGEKHFGDWLSEKLYANIKSKIAPNEWDAFRKIFTAPFANLYKEIDWKKFIEYREKILKKTTAYSLAKFIVESQGTDFAPSSILSFNEEPLLYALINSFFREESFGTKNKKYSPEIIELHTLSALSSNKNRIPYYFCHGALLNWISIKDDFRYRADSNLVFSENQYLNLSNNVYSWQSTTFLHTCANSIIIFIGVSLSDSNMRKWLNCVQVERNKDIGKEVDSTRHFWITKTPRNKETMDWMEASVYHLGVRIIWITSWDQTASVLKKILGF